MESTISVIKKERVPASPSSPISERTVASAGAHDTHTTRRRKRKSPPPPPPDHSPTINSPAALIGALALAARDEASSSSAPIDASHPQQPSDDDYQKGTVVCSTCGEGVPFRDPSSGGFTLRLWDTHRSQCRSEHPPPADPIVFTPETTASALAHPPTKKRRAKRTEEERIDYLRTDPHVAQFEAYRVLCASCNKWIRLRPNSTYCSIPWDAHRKSCLSKKASAKAAYALEERNQILAGDSDAAKVDVDRVLCAVCERWIPIAAENHSEALQTWFEHREVCRRSAAPQRNPSADAPPSAHVQPRHPQLALSLHSSLTSSSSTASLSPQQPREPQLASASALGHVSSPQQFKDLTAATFAPAHESRRRNAEQREAALRADPLLQAVEANRVFCALCRKWVQLRQDSSFCAYPWVQHRGKCVARHQRRQAKAAARNANVQANTNVSAPNIHVIQRDADPYVQARTSLDGDASADGPLLGSEDEAMISPVEPESEEGVESEFDAAVDNGLVQRRHERRAATPPQVGLHRHEYERQQCQRQREMKDVQYRRHAEVQKGMHNDPGLVSGRRGGSSSSSSEASPPPLSRDPSGSGSGVHRRDGGSVSIDGAQRAHGKRAREVEIEREFAEWVVEDVVDDDGGEDLDVEMMDEDDEKDDEGVVSMADGYQRAVDSGSALRVTNIPRGLADLDSPRGRTSFISHSVQYLLHTTYEPTDDLSISALVAYLNGAMPTDKHEDFDAAEVTRAVRLLSTRGEVVLDGDVVRNAG